MPGTYHQAARLALETMDESWHLSAMARACTAIASLLEDAGRRRAEFSMEELSDLLRVHHVALEARMKAVDGLVAALRDALPGWTKEPGAPVTAAWKLVGTVQDRATELRIAAGALAALVDLTPVADEVVCGDLAAAMTVVADALATRAAAIEAGLDALRAELKRQTQEVRTA